MKQEGNFSEHRGEPIEFGPYRPLSTGESVNQEHVVVHDQEGKPVSYIPVRVYGPAPKLNNTLHRKGKA